MTSSVYHPLTDGTKFIVVLSPALLSSSLLSSVLDSHYLLFPLAPSLFFPISFVFCDLGTLYRKCSICTGQVFSSHRRFYQYLLPATEALCTLRRLVALCLFDQYPPPELALISTPLIDSRASLLLLRNSHIALLPSALTKPMFILCYFVLSRCTGS